MELDGTWATRWLRLAAERFEAERAALIDLDREIGDADHGENLDRGFRAVLGRLGELADDATPGQALKLAAATLMSTVGGAAGPLYGSGLVKASIAAGDRAALDGPAASELVRAAADGIRARGRAEPGDKTMVDAWAPAADAARDRAELGGDAAEVLRAAAGAARQGADETAPLVARRGRASYLGERAVGHLDPGAVSTAILLEAAADAAGAE